MKRLLMILLCLSMLLSLAACSSGGVPGAKAESDDSCACGGSSCGTDDLDACCDGTESDMASMSNPEPVVDDLGPEDYAYLVPSQADISRMLDSEATLAVGHLDYQTLYAAWGLPDLHHQEKDDTVKSIKTVSDRWLFVDPELERGLVYIDVYYNLKSGQVSEVCMSGVTGYVSGDILTENPDGTWSVAENPQYWPDLDAGGFESWTVAQALSGNTDEILSRFEQAGLTRNSIRILYDGPYGAYADLYQNYLGDVFRLRSMETGESVYLRVEYDETMHTVPVSVGVYANDSAVPELESEYIFAQGAYNTIQSAPVWPWESESGVDM